MTAVTLGLIALAAALVGVGSYLFNDGREHCVVGLLTGTAGWASLLVADVLRWDARLRDICGDRGAVTDDCRFGNEGYFHNPWNQAVRLFDLSEIAPTVCLTFSAGALGCWVAARRRRSARAAWPPVGAPA